MYLNVLSLIVYNVIKGLMHIALNVSKAIIRMFHGNVKNVKLINVFNVIRQNALNVKMGFN